MKRIDDSVVAELRATLASEQLDDPQWLLTLDDYDEPPLFTRERQIAALGRVPVDLRGATLLALGLEHLCTMAAFIQQQDIGVRFFACVTVSVADFSDVARGEFLAPAIAILVDPCDAQRTNVPKFVPPRTPEALEVERWIGYVGEDAEAQFIATEIFPLPDEEIRRVYVGFRSAGNQKLRGPADDM